MKTNKFSKRILFAALCLTIVQSGTICAAQTSSANVAQVTAAGSNTSTTAASAPKPVAGDVLSASTLTASDSIPLGPWDAAATINVSTTQLDRSFDLGFRIMRNKEIYKALNESFVSNVLSINARGNGLSLSQVLYVLTELPVVAKAIETGIDPQNQSPMTPKQLKELLRPYLANAELKARLASHNDPTRPLRLESVRGGAGYDSMTMYVDHPRMEEPGNPRSKIIPANDLRQVAINFVKGAKKEVMFNVFEFDLKPLAQAMIEANARGVKIQGGVDAASYAAKPEIKEVVDSMLAHKATGLNVTLVVSVGLNHQKMIVRDPGTPNAAVLFLSGNFTQSCIGPEGDAVDLPLAKRPASSVPNANHAVLVRGLMPASVVRQELRKTLIYGLKGSDYPMGGAYQIMGPKPQDPSKKRPFMILTFSPNGGLGDINRDILARVIRETKGPVYALHFAFSSETLRDELLKRIEREAARKHAAGKPATNIFFGVGETPFAMQFWSVFLNLAGLQRDETTKRYSPLALDPLAGTLNSSELTDLRRKIRIAPAVYGEKHVKIDGKDVKTTAKLHHKVFIFPESEVSVVGTSFNPSASAESNQEQVLIIRDASIAKTARQMFDYLYKNSGASIVEEAQRRNQRPIENDEKGDDDDGVSATEAAKAG